MSYGTGTTTESTDTFAIRKDSPFIKTAVLSTSGKLHYDMWTPPFKYRPEKGDTIHTVTSADAGRPDLIAFQYYQNVHLYWLICDFNKILHPINELSPGRKLIIPSKNSVLSYLSSEAGA